MVMAAQEFRKWNAGSYKYSFHYIQKCHLICGFNSSYYNVIWAKRFTLKYGKLEINENTAIAFSCQRLQNLIVFCEMLLTIKA